MRHVVDGEGAVANGQGAEISNRMLECRPHSERGQGPHQ
jgi:hypothetical protein